MLRSSKPLLVAILALAAAPIAAQDDGDSAGQRPVIGLMGTIPVYWGEAAGLDELLSGEAQPHWAREVLERHADLAPLDYLSEEALAPYRYMVMAQPRGLTPEENVALDAWARGGGQLLLFADPMMTGGSRFGIGDRRRPQDVALLSPILAHWGLELQFDPAQEEGLLAVDHFGETLPANLRGEFVPLPDSDECAIPGDGLLAHCSIGLGQALLVADAAMLDIDGPHPHAEAALESLLQHIFPQMRENAGTAGDANAMPAENGGIAPSSPTDAAEVTQMEERG